MSDRCVAGKLSIAVHAFSSDATNTLFQNHKMQGCELESSYLFYTGEIFASAHDVLSISQVKRGFSDLQIVVNARAAGTHALLLKQLKACHSPVWTDYQLHDCAGCSTAIRMFFYTSDEGPDQEAFKRIAITETHDKVFNIFIGSKCWMHVVQLILRSGLLVLDRSSI